MIDLENVSVTYPSGITALDDINIHIEQGEFVFIVGQSGSGKSTLIKLLLKEFNPDKGKIVVHGRDYSKVKRRQVHKVRREIGVVFQNFRLLKDMTIYDNVAFAMRVIGTSASKIRRAVPNALTRVGLSDKHKFYPKELSGGEQQRAAVARALVNQPVILLADEPTGNLDPENATAIMELLEQINQQGTTVLVVTHNQEAVDAMKKRVIALKDGKIVSDEKRSGYSYEEN
ncbi:MAG: cell division ATP-binding protein FtsE [Lachnospiraceae bacterium]